MVTIPKPKIIGSSSKIKSPWASDTSNEDNRAFTGGGMGNYYGTGIKQPVGKLRGDTVGYRPATKKQLGTPPRGVV